MQSEAKIELISRYETGHLDLPAHRSAKYYAVKRAVDVLMSAGLLVILSPIMFLISIAILLYSPGPVFFSQERVGVQRYTRGGKSYWKKVLFRCYKFRTMRVDTDSSIHKSYVQALIEDDFKRMTELQGQPTTIRKLVRDPRVTKPGKLLRKLSLDELPQFWNVLRGDMSLVGPRPAIPYEVEMYRPWHLRRLGAQPGITGLQQLVARSSASFDQQVKLDLQYIENQSIWLDLKIILKTPFVVLSMRGAE